MILTGRLDRIVRFGSESLISFVIPNYQANIELTDKEYKIELNPVKSKRSLQQNKMCWALVYEIAKHEGMDPDTVYCQAIEMAKLKVDIIECIEDALERFRRTFRVVKVLEHRTSKKGVDTVLVALYYGSSDYDTNEMSKLNDHLLDYAARVGIDVSQYGDAWV